jgi:hypothetical protein
VRVLDDNPADLDLLGFDAVVAPVVGAIQRLDEGDEGELQSS